MHRRLWFRPFGHSHAKKQAEKPLSGEARVKMSGPTVPHSLATEGPPACIPVREVRQDLHVHTRVWGSDGLSTVSKVSQGKDLGLTVSVTSDLGSTKTVDLAGASRLLLLHEQTRYVAVTEPHLQLRLGTRVWCELPSMKISRIPKFFMQPTGQFISSCAGTTTSAKEAATVAPTATQLRCDCAHLRLD